MNSNNKIENENNINIKTDIYSIINDSSINKTNQIKSKSREYISTNIKGEKEKLEKQKLILSLSSDIILQDSNDLGDSKPFLNEENQKKKKTYNILVAVRCRPLSKKEKEISEKETIKIITGKIVKLKDPNNFLNPINVRGKEKIMNFDFSFSPSIGQKEIFNNTNC